MKQTILLILFWLFFINTSLSAQNDKGMSKVEDQVEELNKLISKTDASLALTADQKIKVKELYLKRNKEIKSINTGEGSEEEKKEKIKAIRKGINTTLVTEILSKEQKLAKAAAQKSINPKN